MDPVARIWDVLDVSVREQPLDFWVVIRAGSGVNNKRLQSAIQCEKATEKTNTTNHKKRN